MTGMERFAALSEGQLPDRVPVTCNLFEQGAALLGLSPEEYYRCGSHVAEGQFLLQQRYGYDTVWGLFSLAHITMMLGASRISYAEHGPPNVGEILLRSAQDIERFDPCGTAFRSGTFEELCICIRLLRQELNGTCPVMSAVVSSFSLPAMLMGVEHWLELLLFGPEPLADELLTKCSDFCIAHIEALRSAGADFVTYATGVSTAYYLTDPQFERLALPWIRRDLTGSGPGGIVFFGAGGSIGRQIGLLHRETGARIFYLGPDDDIAAAKAACAPDGIVVSPINDISLLSRSPEEIERDVERIMADGKQGGRFVFGTMVMPQAIPEPNIRALLDAAFRHGSYEM